MPAIELRFAGSKYLRRRRRGPGHIAEAVDASAFKIDRCEEPVFDAALAVFQQLVSLLRIDDVAGEKNHSRGLDTRQQVGEFRRHLGAVKANDKELADLLCG